MKAREGKVDHLKTWTQLINDDLRKLRLQSGLTQNRLAWIKVIKETHSTNASMETDLK